MNKKFILSLVIVAVFVAAGYVGYGSYGQQSEDDALLFENVEALASFEVTTTGYSNTHVPCYDVVYVNGKWTTIENGKYQGICWKNPYSNDSCHEHSCSSCSSI